MQTEVPNIAQRVLGERIHGVLTRLGYTQSEVVLFGSRARGDFGSDSDYDLLILIKQEKLSPKEKYRLIDALYFLQLELNVEIQPLIKTKTQWSQRSHTSIHKNINQDGIRL